MPPYLNVIFLNSYRHNKSKHFSCMKGTSNAITCRNINDCVHCEDPIQFLVILPCKHWLCHKCASNQPKCMDEDCSEPIPKDYIYDHVAEISK